MTFPDIVPDLKSRMPELRGRLLASHPLAESAWFRVGGPAQALFMPDDDEDLAYFMKALPAEVPVMVLGAASNVIIRDGGIPGVVVRLGNRFSEIVVEPGHRVRAGTGVLDVRVARAARDAGIAGLEFYSGDSWRNRRRVAYERWCLWRRDQERAGRSARRRPGRQHSHLRQSPTWTIPTATPPRRRT